MNLRPSAVFLHGVNVSPLGLGLGLPRVVVFPLLLLISTNLNPGATRLFLSTGKSTPTAFVDILYPLQYIPPACNPLCPMRLVCTVTVHSTVAK